MKGMIVLLYLLYTYLLGNLYKYALPSSDHKSTRSGPKKSPDIHLSPTGDITEQSTLKSPASYICQNFAQTISTVLWLKGQQFIDIAFKQRI